jgi:hypothetical protein
LHSTEETVSKPQNLSTEIRFENLPNTSVQCYHYTKPWRRASSEYGELWQGASTTGLTNILVSCRVEMNYVRKKKILLKKVTITIPPPPQF